MRKKASKINWLRLSPRILLSFFVLVPLVACQGKGSLFNFKAFKERADETPVPSEQTIEKSFFVDPSGKPKTFLCGWAPEVEIGELGESLFGHLDHASPHCNLEFEIRENALVGKLVNPSFPNDRKRWKEYVEIPIVSHFYYERAKDAHGRDTNEWIENSSRSHWTARPMIKIELSAIRFHDQSLFWSTWINSKQVTHSTVSEIDWDKKSGFLGFTLNARISGSVYGWNLDTEAQAKLRVNFLRFEHDSKFQKTPYHQENARFMNILHIMGRRHDLEPELYAAKWDLSKTTKLYINGANEERIKTLLVSAIEKWNQAFVAEGLVAKGHRVFEPIIQNRAHDFDLRYPGLTWVSDRRISDNSPLGVGHAHADVRNGQILWGGVTLFGGIIERLIQSNLPADGDSSGSASAMERSDRKFPADLKAMRVPEKLALPTIFSELNLGQRSEMNRQFKDMSLGFLESELQRVQTQQMNSTQAKGKHNKEDFEKWRDEQVRSLTKQMEALGKPGMASRIAQDLADQARQMKVDTDQQFSNKNLVQWLGYNKNDSPTAPKLEMAAEDQTALQEIVRSSKTGAERSAKLRRFVPGAISKFPDQELTGRQLRASMARSSAHGKRSVQDMYDGFVMDLTLHEVGHMIGLGHQFKENILPDEGTVPSAVYNELKGLATKSNEYTNATSVMGYKSGRNWLQVDANTVSPGVQDRLVLHYLYGRQFSVYDKSKDKFEFVNVDSHGLIPESADVHGQRLKVSYFPQCNDIEASWDADPFCNRWDRGNTATELVTSYFEELSDNLVADLYSFVGGRRADPELNEWYLWARSFGTLSRTRLFYDELRLMLETDKDFKPLWDRVRGDENALYEFSTACQADGRSSIQSTALKELFYDFGAKSERARDLCRATGLALSEMSFLMTLPESDYTKIDHKERYIMGGMLAGEGQRDTRQLFGKWYQLTNLPLKVASLFTLTSPTAFLSFGWANPFYMLEGRTPLYRTLFPREYTKLVADMVKSNLQFESLGDADRTTLGHTILYSSFLLPRQNFGSSDAGLLPSDYLRTLKNQNQFQFSLAAVLVTATQSQADSKTKANYYKRFTGTIFDIMLNKSRTARDVYLLPRGSVLVRVNDMFIVPLTQLRFLDDNNAYIIGIKIDYDYEVGDRLLEGSVKYVLNELHERVNSTCVAGFDGSGLGNYFSSSNDSFEGFYIPPGISTESGKEKTTLFFESIDEEFSKYEKKVHAKMTGPYKEKTMKLVCDQALRGVGQISSAAALLNGFWLPITGDFIR